MQSNKDEQSLIAASQKIFQGFCKTLAKVQPSLAAVYGASAGVTTSLIGIGMDIRHQQNLFSEGGPAAVKAYQALGPDTVLGYMGNALAQELPSLGQNVAGAGAWMALTLPIAAYAAAKLLKEFAAARTEPEPAPRGATRVTTPSNRLDSALAMTSQRVNPETVQESKPVRGPKN